MREFGINIKGKIYEYTRPIVMGILNITPDSFYAESRATADSEIRKRVRQMIDAGADWIDVGAYSTRPGHQQVSTREEIDRLYHGMAILRDENSDIPVSVDTFRSEVAYKAIAEMGADMINDVTGGNHDPQIYDVAAALHAPYILTHSRGDIDTMHHSADYNDLLAEIVEDLARKVVTLQLKGVCDIIIDPGFGFSKTTEQNYSILRQLNALQSLHLPILTGVSRKSMITLPLGISASDAAIGTAVVQTLALLQGASILRVHDVKAARQAIALVELYNN